MATRNQVTYSATGPAKRERWSNATQVGDPAAGYVQLDPTSGAVIAGSARALTAEESAWLATEDLSINRQSIADKGITALTANATFLAIASPSNAQVSAQVKALTRQIDGLIRLVLDRPDDTSGT